MPGVGGGVSGLGFRVNVGATIFINVMVFHSLYSHGIGYIK